MAEEIQEVVAAAAAVPQEEGVCLEEVEVEELTNRPEFLRRRYLQEHTVAIL